MSTELAKSDDSDTTMRMVESIILRGDLSGLSPQERASYYVQMCEKLGLNPVAQPFAILKLNGKEILYVTRGATDQLAALHRLNREIIDGPKVIDLGGVKLVYAVCRATHPNGRFETAIATVPLADHVNVLMKVETKAKRRATLSILGLGLLDEMEVEAIQSTPPIVHVPLALEEWQERVAMCESIEEVAHACIDTRPTRKSADKASIEKAWTIAVDMARKVGDIKSMEAAHVSLKHAVAKIDGPPDGGGTTVTPSAPAVNDTTTEKVQEDSTQEDVPAMNLETSKAWWKSYIEQCETPQHIAAAHKANIDRVPMAYQAECTKISKLYLMIYKHAVPTAAYADQVLAGTAELVKRKKDKAA